MASCIVCLIVKLLPVTCKPCIKWIFKRLQTWFSRRYIFNFSLALQNVEYNNVCCKLHIYVVKDLKTNLLGLPAVTALNLVARIQSILCSKESVVSKNLYRSGYQAKNTRYIFHDALCLQRPCLPNIRFALISIAI